MSTVERNEDGGWSVVQTEREKTVDRIHHAHLCDQFFREHYGPRIGTCYICGELEEALT